MLKNKALPLLILIILSFVPFVLIMYTWFTIPKDIEIGGLIYIAGIPLLLPIVVTSVFFVFRRISIRLNLTKLPTIIILLVPLGINLISTQWYFIQVLIIRTAYFRQYEGLVLEAKLLNGNLVPHIQAVYNFAADYSYRLVLNNPSDRRYENVPTWIYLKYNTSDNNERDLGLSILNLTLLPGENVLEDRILIDSYDLRCRYTQAQTPLRLKVTQKILNKETSVSIPLDLKLPKELMDINDDLEFRNSGAAFPLRTCL
jgi:hypothetical protein